eukprot:TRINITY_DN23664_c0_g1_i1.p1 TRINITY_DN23664_c0_g1~~TRINITY_DN23664_c0_g1_i1.p1  ORF type:complete len:142 (+),score=24.50 TRINITY_DN23664_c0_g1_i1:40-426(+)
MTNLFVSGLSPTMSSDDLRDMFAKFGSIEKVFVVEDKTTGLGKGYGFVLMEKPEEAEAAIQALDSTQQLGRTIRVNIAKEKKESNQNQNERGGPRYSSFSSREDNPREKGRKSKRGKPRSRNRRSYFF